METAVDLLSGKEVTIQSLKMLLVGGKELRLAGTLTEDAVNARVAEQLDALDGHITRTKARSFRVDVRALTFVTSSAVRVFVNWISKAERGGYKLVFVIDRSVTWHRLSFSVLKSLAPTHVELVDAQAATSEK